MLVFFRFVYREAQILKIGETFFAKIRCRSFCRKIPLDPGNDF
jgi:hypothetical protein